MPSPFSQTYKADVKLMAILAQASRLINLQGSSATTLTDVAREMGLAKTSVYHYVRNKEELIYRCYLASCDFGDEMMSEASAGSETGLQCLLNFLRIFFKRRSEMENGVRPHAAMLIETQTLSEDHRADVEARKQSHFQTLLGYVERGVVDGSIAPCQPIPTALAFGDVINWSYVWWGRVAPAEREHVTSLLLDVVQHGISTSYWHFSDSQRAHSQPKLTAAFDRDEQSQIRKEAFLRVGTHMFNQRGYSGTSIDEITQRLQVTKGAFYYYFTDKEDLLLQCFERTIDLGNVMLVRATSSVGAGLQKVEQALRGLFDVQHNEEGPLIAFRALPSLKTAHRRVVFDQTQSLSDKLGELVNEGIRDGSVRDLDPKIIENVIIGAVDGAPEVAAHMQIKDSHQVSKEYLNLFFNGLVRRPE